MIHVLATIEIKPGKRDAMLASSTASCRWCKQRRDASNMVRPSM